MVKPFRILFLILLTVLIIVLSSCDKEREPLIPKNQKPQIEKLFAKPFKVPVNKKTELVCVAKDIDGDSLTITWSSKRGSFSSKNVAKTFWTAPSTIGIDTIHIKISDGKSTTTGFLIIQVGVPPNAPLLQTPKNKSVEVDLNPILYWKNDKNALKFILQVSKDESFKSIVSSYINLKKSQQKIEGLELNKIYYWRVKSSNDFGISNWSETFSFKTVAPPTTPNPISPINFSKDVLLNSVLVWGKINNANYYALQVSEDQDYSKLLIEEKNYADTSLTAYNLNNFQKYFWRVKSINKYGESDWSDSWTFSVVGKPPETPSLIHPLNNSFNIEIEMFLTWKHTTHAENYTLQVSTDSLFGSLLINKDKLKTLGFAVTDLEYFTKYYWRVLSSNKYGKSDWSSINSFTTKIASPELTSIDIFENGRPLSPIFRWSPVNGAESYKLQVAYDSTFNDLVFSDTAIISSKQKISGLHDYTNYYWRVAASSKFGNSKWTPVQSFKTTGYYYQGLPYGSQSLYNPAYVIWTGGYGMIQFDAKRDIINFPYNIAIKNVWRNLKDPFTPIRNYGWGNFIQDQVFPLSLNKKNGQFWPNYSLHLIGGGMAYAKTREWFKYHNYPYPSLLSAFTTMTYHFINEVVENGWRVGDDVDPIADFYLFDIGGIVLFSSESVKRFFAEELNLSDWSQQPSLSLRNGEIHNNDQFFSVKWKFPFSDSWHAFYYFGTNGVGGLSYKFNNGTAISVGAGLAASDLIVLDEKTNKKTLGLVGNFAAFYDKNNSLLASLAVTIKTDYMVNVNIYPGLVKIGGFSPGLWGAYSQNGNYIFGITATWLPIGFAYSTK